MGVSLRSDPLLTAPRLALSYKNQIRRTAP
jgi:hypothetical protein